MIIVNIILGLIGLGIVILVHEFGHFLSAKLAGITVEAFSVGWGKKLFSFQRGETEYRISMLPIGGYCKMKGEEILRSAVEEGADRFPDEPGSLFSVSPWKRIATYFAGPAANFVFAIVVLSIIWFAGFTIRTFDNRIVLLSESPFAQQERYPADIAGLQTGDRIVEMEGEPIDTFQDLETHVAPNPGKTIDTVIERDGRRISVELVPELDRDTGAGRIGVAAWVEPTVAAVSAGSGADRAGLEAGDRILTANGVTINNSIDLNTVLVDQPNTVSLTVLRDGSTFTTDMPIGYTEDGQMHLGFTALAGCFALFCFFLHLRLFDDVAPFLEIVQVFVACAAQFNLPQLFVRQHRPGFPPSGESLL